MTGSLWVSWSIDKWYGGKESSLEVPGTDCFPDIALLEIVHQRREAGLGFLQFHGFGLDGADFAHCVLLLIFGE